MSSAALSLRPMSESDYEDWLAICIPEYAAEKVAAGTWLGTEALQRAQDSLASLLPQGLATPNHWLFTLRGAPDDGRIGFLWFGRFEHTAYLYDIYIAPAHRRRGYGSKAMELLETAAAVRGFTSIALHVFGFNTGARDLYLKQGYTITDLTMRKELPPAAEHDRGRN